MVILSSSLSATYAISASVPLALRAAVLPGRRDASLVSVVRLSTDGQTERRGDQGNHMSQSGFERLLIFQVKAAK